MPRILSLLLVIALAGPSWARNDKGHMVVARLAWLQLTPDQRTKVVQILKKKHPHYEEFLAAKKPDGYSEAEWVFMRAATWADWVRSHHRSEFNHGPWHYVNYPYIPPGSEVDPAKHQPRAGQENVVNGIALPHPLPRREREKHWRPGKG